MEPPTLRQLLPACFNVLLSIHTGRVPMGDGVSLNFLTKELNSAEEKNPNKYVPPQGNRRK